MIVTIYKVKNLIMTYFYFDRNNKYVEYKASAHLLFVKADHDQKRF